MFCKNIQLAILALVETTKDTFFETLPFGESIFNICSSRDKMKYNISVIISTGINIFTGRISWDQGGSMITVSQRMNLQDQLLPSQMWRHILAVILPNHHQGPTTQQGQVTTLQQALQQELQQVIKVQGT